MTSFEICGVESFVAEATPQAGSLEEAASAQEILIQQLEGYLTRMQIAVCADVTSIQATIDGSTFVALTDTPASYVGSGLQGVRVNAAETALEFAALLSTFSALTDTPASYVGAGLQGVRVNAAETALEYAALLSTFLALTDTPASYAGQALRHARVNAGETAIEFSALAAVTYLALTDTPATYAGQALRHARVNAGETAIEFAALAAVTFLALTDVPASYAGQALSALRVNAGETALEYGQPTLDHGGLGGLLDDDHTQYLLIDGTRSMSGELNMGNNKIVNMAGGAAAGDAIEVTQALAFFVDIAGDTMTGNLTMTDNDAVRFGTGGDSTILYNGTNTIWNPDAVGSGRVIFQGDIQFRDNDVIFFGTGSDATITYDGTNFLFDPDVVGSGFMQVGGDFRATGDVRANADFNHNGTDGLTDDITFVDANADQHDVEIRGGIITVWDVGPP